MLAIGQQNLASVGALESQDGRCCWRVRQKTQDCSFCGARIDCFCLHSYHPLEAAPILLFPASSCGSVPALAKGGIIRPLPGTSHHAWDRRQFCLCWRQILSWFLLPSHKVQVLSEESIIYFSSLCIFLSRLHCPLVASSLHKPNIAWDRLSHGEYMHSFRTNYVNLASSIFFCI